MNFVHKITDNVQVDSAQIYTCKTFFYSEKEAF